MKLAHVIVLGAAFCAFPFFDVGRAGGDGAEATTLFVVRHAEKIGESDDAQLSDVGRERARTLAWMLRDVSFDAVYSTDFARTRDTIASIARSNGTKLSFYSPKPGALKGVIDGKHSGETVLIVGHSNTIPTLLGELGTPIEDEILPGFDDLFVVTMDPRAGATTLRLHYPGKL